MTYIGDFALEKTFDHKFTTVAAATGLPTTLAGTPVVSAYAGNSLTELTAGITLTVDFDARTGLHNVRVVATAANGYATGTNYQLVLTAGTVGGTSVVGYVIGSFSIEARSALRPATADRTLDVTAASKVNGVVLVDTLTTYTGNTVQTGDSFARIGATGSGLTSLATPTNITAGTITTVTNLTNLPAIPANWITATGIAADAITDAKVASDVTIASVTGAVGSVAGQTLANLDVASSTLATAANLATVAGYIDTEVASILAAVDTEVAAIKAKTDNLPGATMAELAQGIPPATPSLEQALMALYMTLRNKLDVTATTKSVTNDAGTVIFKKALSDDGTTYSEAEAVSGP